MTRTPGQFLRLVWSDVGHYCIAYPFDAKVSSTPNVHKVFATIGEAVTCVHELQPTTDTFFAVLTLREARVWDPKKIDYKTQTEGAWATRKQSNMLSARAVFFDLDVGNDPAKYPTQQDALGALVTFLQDTLLPQPTLISSGGGVHVYWHFDEVMPVAEWSTLALHMKQLAGAFGLKVDPTRTTDTTSVLRVPESFNWKDQANPRKVMILQDGVVTPLATLQQIVSDALIRSGTQPGVASAPAGAAPIAGASAFPAQPELNTFGPPSTVNEVAAACGQAREIISSQCDPKHPYYGKLDQTAWYKGLMATFTHVEHGDTLCRKLTELHPRNNSDVEFKLRQLKGFAPARCGTLASVMPWKDAPCLKCKFVNDPSVPNPIAASRRSTLAPPPSAAPPSASPAPSSAPPPLPMAAPQPISFAVMAAMIPDPPKPYERLKTGGISITKMDKDGNESSSVIYAYDIYPLKRLTNNETGVEQQTWRVTLPRSGVRDFTIDADVLYDSRKFSTAISNNGIYPNKADIPALQDYMVAYISQLQRALDADNQLSHLGWSDGFRRFVLPDKTFMEDGTVRNTALTTGAGRASQYISKRGDLQTQVSLMGFYNHPAYLPNQFAVLCSLASVIFYATGHHGIVVNMSGDSGASKSTTLAAASSVWGDPALWPINGTNRGATANARAQRIATNANLPTPVDEITHLPVKEAVDLVMTITQPGHRLRLGVDGAERAAGADEHKSAIMISTANSSLHTLLSTDNAAGTAASMRVFEMKFVAQRVHTKAEADEFLRQLKQNFGHIGEVFVQFVVRHRAQVEQRVQAVMREIDAEAHIAGSERFWSAVIATALVAAEICKTLGLLPYDMAAIRKWAIEKQIPYMRGVVTEEYREPLAVLTDYIAEKYGNILVLNTATAIGVNTAGTHVAADMAYADNRINGALLGHLDVRTNMLYLLKQGFKDHCSRIGASSTRILDALNQPHPVPGKGHQKIVVDRNIRRTLGAGTPLAKGQTWCFAVDMAHPLIAGSAPAVAASGGVATSPPAGNLKAVT